MSFAMVGVWALALLGIAFVVHVPHVGPWLALLVLVGVVVLHAWVLRPDKDPDKGPDERD